MNKEIKEMAEAIFCAGVALDGSDFAYKSDNFERLAKILYHEAGYRKQSSTVKEFVERLLLRLSDYIMRDFEDGVPYYGADCEQINDVIATIAAEYGVELERLVN
jgi:hypothetical protein